MQNTGQHIGFDTGLALANTLIAQGLIGEDQVVYAQRIQSKLAEEKTLLNTMLELDYFSKSQLNTALQKAKLNIRLGDLLVELGDISARELQHALRLQKEDAKGKKLGEILIEHRILKEQRLIDVLANQLGYPQIEPEITVLDHQIMPAHALTWCQQYQFFPVRLEDRKLVVTTTDPLNPEIRNVAKRMIECDDVEIGICARHMLEDAINKYKQRDSRQQKVHLNEESHIVHLVDDLLAAAVKYRASDIHLEPGHDEIRVRFRRDGVLWLYKELPLSLGPSIVSRLKIMSKANIAEKRRHQDGKLVFNDPDSGQPIDVRCSFYVSIHGEKACLRLLNRKATLLNIDEICMAPAVLERFKLEALDVPNGVVLITGPTGSGKTTTLYGCVDYLNNDNTSIITAEEPVEYVIEGITQCSLNPKIDLTFDETLRHMVRQDPDVIVLGEIRDSQSAEAAIQAALTGHKVLTTFHTEDTIGGLLRLMNMNIETFLISSTVVSVLAQRLLRRVCPHCAQDYVPTPLEMQRLGLTMDDVRTGEFKIGAGCHHCHDTGYDSRICIFELLVLNERVKDAILQNRSSYDIRRISIETSGLITLLEDGIEKASRGLTTLAEVLRMLPRMDKPRPLSEIHRLSRGNFG